MMKWSPTATMKLKMNSKTKNLLLSQNRTGSTEKWKKTWIQSEKIVLGKSRQMTESSTNSLIL